MAGRTGGVLDELRIADMAAVTGVHGNECVRQYSGSVCAR